MQRRAAHDLHVVGALAERALGGLAHGGERLGHELVERLAGLVARAQLGGLAPELFVGEVRVVLFEGVDGLHDLLKPPEDASLTGAKQFLERVGHGVSPSVRLRVRRDRRRCCPARMAPRHTCLCYPPVTLVCAGCGDVGPSATRRRGIRFNGFRVCIYSVTTYPVCIDERYDMVVWRRWIFPILMVVILGAAAAALVKIAFFPDQAPAAALSRLHRSPIRSSPSRARRGRQRAEP